MLNILYYILKPLIYPLNTLPNMG